MIMFTPADTPLEVNVTYLQDEDEHFPNSTLYQKLFCTLSLLLGLAFCMLSPSVLFLASSHICSLSNHWKYCSHAHELVFTTRSLKLLASNDANWVECSDIRHSMITWYMYLSYSSTSWKSKKKQEWFSKSSRKNMVQCHHFALQLSSWMACFL